MYLQEALTKLHEILRVLLGESADEWALQKKSTSFDSDYEWAQHLLAVHRECCHNDCCKLNHPQATIVIKDEALDEPPIEPSTHVNVPRPVSLFPRHAIRSRLRARHRRTRNAARGHQAPPHLHEDALRIPNSSSLPSHLQQPSTEAHDDPSVPVLPSDSRIIVKTEENVDDDDDDEIMIIQPDAGYLATNKESRTIPGEFASDPRHYASDSKHYASDSKHYASDSKHYATDSKHYASDSKHYASDHAESSFTLSQQYEEVSDWLYSEVNPEQSTSEEVAYADESQCYYGDGSDQLVDSNDLKAEMSDEQTALQSSNRHLVADDSTLNYSRVLVPAGSPLYQPHHFSTNGRMITGSNLGNVQYLRRFLYSNVPTFACELCGKTFTEKGNLKRHSVVHTGEKSFVCDQCGCAFTQKVSLKKHKTSIGACLRNRLCYEQI